jgi:RNA polymerase sigma-70 factor (ECF subfamily)
MLRTVDTASPNSGNLALPLAAAAPVPAEAAANPAGISPELLRELWQSAGGASSFLTIDEFSHTLRRVGARLNHHLPAGQLADAAQKAHFFRALHLPELALAQACALGREPAWNRFLEQYRASLTQAAIAIAGSPGLGHDLAGSLYAELYGLREVAGQRQSPLASYSGRGSLLGWLRATLAQRYINHHRLTRRESPLEAIDAPAPSSPPTPPLADLALLTQAVAVTLQALPAADRYLLASYYLDRRTIQDLGRQLRVHESTISRRLHRLTAALREQLKRNLQHCGLSRAAAEEALGTDPRDLEINLAKLLQTSQLAPFHAQRQSHPAGQPEPGPPVSNNPAGSSPGAPAQPGPSSERSSR